MDGYSKVLLVGIIILIISMIYEMHYPFMDESPSTAEYIHIHLLRYLHYLILLFSTFYLAFFNGVGKPFDRYFYLSLVLMICVGWYIFDCCWLSFFEILFYNTDLDKTETTFHPTFYSIFRKYDGYIVPLLAIIMVITTGIVLYSLKSINIIYRAGYAILFLGLFIDSIIKGRLNTKYYSIKNSQLESLKAIKEYYTNLIL